MSRLVESLKRLYESGKRTFEEIEALTSITDEEKAYILGE